MEYKERKMAKTDYSQYLGSFDTKYIIFRNVENFQKKNSNREFAKENMVFLKNNILLLEMNF